MHPWTRSVFCRTYDDSSPIYLFIQSRLGVLGVQPIGAPDLSRFRLVGMFTSCTHKDVKESILANFLTLKLFSES